MTIGTQYSDTICAIATPPGLGGIGIIRISGSLTKSIADSLLGNVPPARQAQFAHFKGPGGDTIDTGVVLFFPSPHSFTGEDVLELQGHGGAVIQQMLLKTVIKCGARLARPGEFSERAFLNDKLDLTQAEAISDLIEANTEAAARAAQRSLDGVFSDQVNLIQGRLTELRVFVEAALDFPDEEIDFLADSDVLARAEGLQQQVEQLSQQAHQGKLLRDGITLTITGLPNAGKSSLLNQLAGHDAAIVAENPGTTRDVLREHISMNGLPVHVIDTAGIRESGDAVEAEGVRRARRALQAADIALLVIDPQQPLTPQEALEAEVPRGATCIRVYNKIDLTGKDPQIIHSGHSVYLSAKTGAGINLLIELVCTVAGVTEVGEGSFSARTRHLEALHSARNHIEEGARQLVASSAAEVFAEELRLAQTRLGEITGEFLPEDLLGAIFASFCIGK
jgi:tRNA modification GTPase